MAPKMSPEPAQKSQKSDPEKGPKIDAKIIEKMPPKRTQNGAKTGGTICHFRGPKDHGSKRPSWSPLGAILGPSWGYLGAILGLSLAILGLSWANLGPSWGYLGPSWGHLGPSWSHLGSFWGSSWALWSSCGHRGAIPGPSVFLMYSLCILLSSSVLLFPAIQDKLPQIL